MRKKKKTDQIDSEIEKLQAVAEENGLLEATPKREHKKKVADRRYWIFGAKIGSDKRETWASVSTGETCAVNQFVKKVPGFCIWGVMLECYVDPEKYKDNPVYQLPD